MDADIDRILIRRDRIAERVASMGKEIADAYPPDCPCLTLVAILSGAVIFLADLIRQIPREMRLSLVTVSSYPGSSTSSRGAKMLQDLSADLAGEHVLVVDDILDTGNTLRLVQSAIRTHHPASLKTAVLLRKPTKAPPDLHVDFIGFDIEDEFVVGYGLDYDDRFRNYPHIATLRARVLAAAQEG
jgi:hypoxanthine phosphoribosyltransferase